jgi:hypothetical protein
MYRAVRNAKRAVVLSAATTVLCGAGILVWQFTSWLQTDTWVAFPVARIFEIAGLRGRQTYVLTSSSNAEPKVFDATSITDWWLDAPALVPLLIAGALLTGLYLWLKEIEKEISVTRASH